MHAACCNGVALLPQYGFYDGFEMVNIPRCIDFRAMRYSLAGELAATRCAPVRSTSRMWFSTPPLTGNGTRPWVGWLARTTPQACTRRPDLQQLVRTVATLYAGFGRRKEVLGKRCPASVASLQTLVIHARSGDIFTHWRNGRLRGYSRSRAATADQRFNRGQPPLAFYKRVVAELRARPGPPLQRIILVASDDANPVVRAGTFGAGLRVDRTLNGSLRDDLVTLLCAHRLIMSASSLNLLFRDSSMLRESFIFEGRYSTSPCQQDCDEGAAGGSASVYPYNDGRPCESQPREMRARALAPYSPALRWLNSEHQRREMLGFDHVGPLTLTPCRWISTQHHAPSALDNSTTTTIL